MKIRLELESLDRRLVPASLGSNSAFLANLASIDPFLMSAAGASVAATTVSTPLATTPTGTVFGFTPAVDRFRGTFGLGLPSRDLLLSTARAAARFGGNFGVGVARTSAANTFVNGLNIGFQPTLPINPNSRVFGGFSGLGTRVDLSRNQAERRLFALTPTTAGNGLSAGSLFESSPAFAPAGAFFGASPTFAPPSSTFGASPTFAPASSIFDGSPTFAPAGSIFGASPSFALNGSEFGASSNTAAGVLGPNSPF
jgi:hypothetical protein